ncbi:hypothetical protein GRAN_2291 [Granulicella sibirica]|uniref:Uncharacterized protein n=1 Tax=Granulicella sibirica TaxID=2479048 RepID=A0A4V1L5E0_9BACT|nr:hypothetical protein GRAN_2291 [Granulicella sibirica]
MQKAYRAFGQSPLLCDVILVRSYENDREIKSLLFEPALQLDAIHIRHTNIGN